MIKDMPKLHSPFVRMQTDEGYFVTPLVEQGYEWVFDDPNVVAVEKLDGTNVSLVLEGGSVLGVFNRVTRIPHGTLEDNRFMQGIRKAYSKKHFPIYTGQHFGELMGPKIQRNLLNLKEYEWFPFDYLKLSCVYGSWHKIDHTFEAVSDWMKNLESIMYKRFNAGVGLEPPEGVVFYHPDGRLAKLRRDMFSWYDRRRTHR